MILLIKLLLDSLAGFLALGHIYALLYSQENKVKKGRLWDITGTKFFLLIAQNDLLMDIPKSPKRAADPCISLQWTLLPPK